MTSERRLHIGGKEPRPGWEILDVNPGPHVDHVGDAVDLARFADDSFVEIYASHVLEHFDYRGGLVAALREWRRVLAPGGLLRISVPDIDILAHLLLQRHKFNVDQRFQIMRMIFGGHVDAHDYHLVGLNQDFLAGFLGSAGFEQMQRVQRHDIFRDTSELQVAGTPISINVTARKPLPVHAPAAPLAATA
ncbi:MAG: methyltransferase domain-containing protein [Burkholderiales bacterium]|nr:methyltransferase domain-containing protein [Burkholderiales bacterium]